MYLYISPKIYFYYESMDETAAFNECHSNLMSYTEISTYIIK